MIYKLEYEKCFDSSKNYIHITNSTSWRLYGEEACLVVYRTLRVVCFAFASLATDLYECTHRYTVLTTRLYSGAFKQTTEFFKVYGNVCLVTQNVQHLRCSVYYKCSTMCVERFRHFEFWRSRTLPQLSFSHSYNAGVLVVNCNKDMWIILLYDRYVYIKVE